MANRATATQESNTSHQQAENVYAPGVETPSKFHDASSGTRSPTGDLTGCTDPTPAVLLVDDDDDLRYVMSVLLQTMGYAVVPCCDAQGALEMFCSSATFDLLLTDIEMPGRSGVELAREVAALRPTLPVLIVSGSVIPSELTQEMWIREWRFLSKPFDVPTFLKTVESLLRPKQLQAA